MMEKPKEKKQNNRKEDEQRDGDSDKNATVHERTWDPDREDEEITHGEKIKKLKGVRIPKNSKHNEK